MTFTFLDSGNVTQLRGLAWMTLSEVGHIGTATVSDDSGGGSVSDWAYGGVIPCRVDPIGENEVEDAGRISDRSTHIVTLPPGTTISAANRFTIDGLGTFEVTAVQVRTDEHVRFVEVVKIT